MKIPTLLLLFLFLFFHPAFIPESGAQTIPVERKFNNGTLKKSYNQDDEELLQGPYTAWFRNGQLRAQGNLKNSKEEGPWQYFYKNGNPAGTLSYVDGKLQGKMSYYYSTGELLEERSFEADVQVGTFQSYYRSGAKRSTGQFVAGNLDGPLTTYNEDGTIRKVKVCACGKKVTTRRKNN